MTPNLIALTGYARSGKDTFADALVHHHGYTKRSLGDLIKRDLWDLVFDISRESRRWWGTITPSGLNAGRAIDAFRAYLDISVSSSRNKDVTSGFRYFCEMVHENLCVDDNPLLHVSDHEK